MSANYNTKFPDGLREWHGTSELTIYLFEESGTDAYSKEMVDDWFKRCLEDYPEREDTDPSKANARHYEALESWFEKWFSQFKEK